MGKYLIFLILSLLLVTNSFAATVWLDTRIDVTPGSDGTWTDITTGTTSLPDGTTAVFCQFVNTSGAAAKLIGVRSNGSSDSNFLVLGRGDQSVTSCGVDGDETFESYRQDFTVEIYLVGYTNEATFPVDRSADVAPGTYGEWTDVDVSALIDEANSSGVHLIVGTVTNTRKWGIRANGSTDNLIVDLGPNITCAAYVKTDSNGVFEAYVEDTQPIIYVIGEFASSGFSFNTNATVKTLTDASTWEDFDVTTEEANATGIIADTQFEINVNFGVRKNGLETAYIGTSDHRSTLACGVDADDIFEGYSSNVTYKIYVVGYSKEAAVAGVVSQVIGGDMF